MPKRLQETKNRRLLWAVIKSMQASSHKVFEQIAKTRVQSSGSRFFSGGHLAPAHKEGLLLPLTTAGYIAPDRMMDVGLGGCQSVFLLPVYEVFRSNVI